MACDDVDEVTKQHRARGRHAERTRGVIDVAVERLRHPEHELSHARMVTRAFALSAAPASTRALLNAKHARSRRACGARSRQCDTADETLHGGAVPRTHL